MVSESLNFINIRKTDIQARHSFRESVYELLKNAYNEIGGIGIINGFSTCIDMDASTDTWILLVDSDLKVIKCVILKIKVIDGNSYHKAVAYGSKRPLTLDEAENVRKFREHFHIYMMENYFMEISGNFMFSFIKSVSKRDDPAKYIICPKLALPTKEIIMFDESKTINLDTTDFVTYTKLKSDYPEFLKHCYIRSIGGKPKLKIIFGTLKKL